MTSHQSGWWITAMAGGALVGLAIWNTVKSSLTKKDTTQEMRTVIRDPISINHLGEDHFFDETLDGLLKEKNCLEHKLLKAKYRIDRINIQEQLQKINTNINNHLEQQGFHEEQLRIGKRGYWMVRSTSSRVHTVPICVMTTAPSVRSTAKRSDLGNMPLFLQTDNPHEFEEEGLKVVAYLRPGDIVKGRTMFNPNKMKQPMFFLEEAPNEDEVPSEVRTQKVRMTKSEFDDLGLFLTFEIMKGLGQQEPLDKYVVTDEVIPVENEYVCLAEQDQVVLFHWLDPANFQTARCCVCGDLVRFLLPRSGRMLCADPKCESIFHLQNKERRADTQYSLIIPHWRSAFPILHDPQAPAGAKLSIEPHHAPPTGGLTLANLLSKQDLERYQWKTKGTRIKELRPRVEDLDLSHLEGFSSLPTVHENSLHGYDPEEAQFRRKKEKEKAKPKQPEADDHLPYFWDVNSETNLESTTAFINLIKNTDTSDFVIREYDLASRYSSWSSCFTDDTFDEDHHAYDHWGGRPPPEQVVVRDRQ